LGGDLRERIRQRRGRVHGGLRRTSTCGGGGCDDEREHDCQSEFHGCSPITDVPFTPAAAGMPDLSPRSSTASAVTIATRRDGSSLNRSTRGIQTSSPTSAAEPPT